MILVLIFLVYLLSLGNEQNGQNLLQNGSFESFKECPDEPGELYLCEYWSIPNNSTPDFFHTCQNKIGSFGIPYNYKGHQVQFSGDAYIGLVLVTATSELRDYREYIQGELREELKENTQYTVTFYLNWSDFSNYFCNRIGYLFSTDRNLTSKKKRQRKDKKTSKHQAYRSTIIEGSSGSVELDLERLSDRNSWHKVEFQYRAKGGERFIVLGLFGDNFTEQDYQLFASKVYGNNFSTNYEKDWEGAYYYIDSISVVEGRFSHY